LKNWGVPKGGQICSERPARVLFLDECKTLPEITPSASSRVIN